MLSICFLCCIGFLRLTCGVGKASIDIIVHFTEEETAQKHQWITQGHAVWARLKWFLILSPGHCHNCAAIDWAAGSWSSLAMDSCSYLKDSRFEISLILVVCFAFIWNCQLITLFFMDSL